MHKLINAVSIIFALCSLSACYPKEPSQPKPPMPQTSGAIPQAQLDALNKAKNVEQVLQQQAQQRGEQSEP